MDEQLAFAKQIVQRLTSAGIEYMMTGSMAMAVYATPRMTRDIDMVVDVGEEDIDTLVSLFESDCYIARQAVVEAIRTHGMFNIIHNDWIIKADFIVRKPGPYRQTEFERRRQIDIQGLSVAVVAPEDLILSKLEWMSQTGSELQRRDVREILAAGVALDWPYLEEWSKHLGIGRLLDEVKK